MTPFRPGSCIPIKFVAVLVLLLSSIPIILLIIFNVVRRPYGIYDNEYQQLAQNCIIIVSSNSVSLIFFGNGTNTNTNVNTKHDKYIIDV